MKTKRLTTERELRDAWQAGEIEELALYLDDKAGQGTFFRWSDEGVGYMYPCFVAGDEKMFDEHQRMLINHGQDNRQIQEV